MSTLLFEPQTAEEWGAELEAPTAEDLREARRSIAEVLPPTPVVRAWALERELGCQLYLKLETFQPLNVFKVRGALNVVHHLSAAERRRGVVCASTGNFGQSVAWAAARAGVPATVFVPLGANPVKLARIQAQGAVVREVGRDFDDARAAAEEYAAETGRRYMHSANDPLLIAGAGTHAAEFIEQVPELDMLFVPVGGGSGAAGACLAREAVGARLAVVGVQSTRAPAAHETWARGTPVKTAEVRTRAEGLATRMAFRMPMALLRAHLDDFMLVPDRALTEAAGGILATVRVLAEEAGAASVAGIFAKGSAVRGKRVGAIISGGNPSPAAARAILRAALKR